MQFAWGGRCIYHKGSIRLLASTSLRGACVIAAAQCLLAGPLAAAPKLCTSRPDAVVKTIPADPEEAWDTARRDGGCSVYQNAKVKLAGRPKRHLFAYLPAGFDPRVVISNGVAPDEISAAGPRYAFATDAFGTLRHDPSGKGNIFTASFVPPIWQLWPGDVLHVRLITCVSFASLSPMHAPVSYPQDGTPTMAAGPDACPSGSAPAKPEDFVTNLHTHGLIVAPHNSLGAVTSELQDGTGDNIFVSVPDDKKFDFQIAIPPGHPSGLYWYHPHVHGVSARQVTGGMSGLIAIGDPIDLLRAPGEAKATISDAQLQVAERAESDIRYVILKDTQMVTQDKPERGDQVVTGNRLAPVDAGLCADPTQRVNNVARDEQGICWINNPNYSWQNTDPTDPNAPKTTVTGYPVWLFTVNGERYPTFETKPGKRSFIFRISNQSASVSYDLRIIDDLDSNRAVSFELLTIDGVLAGAPQNGATKVAPARADHILLMPAARAEIRVPVPPEGKKYELVANDVVRDAINKPVGLITGPGTYGSNGGDSWPYVLLARILGKAGPEAPRQVALNSQSTELETAAKELSGAPQTPSGCVDSLKLNGVTRRIVVLTTDGDTFEMGYSKGSTGDPESQLIPPTPFPHPLIWRDTKVGDTNYHATPHVCVALGEEEIWEIRNLTSELHNFHIHQAKFRMATADEIKSVTQAGVLSGDVPPNSPIPKNPVKCSEPEAGRDAPCWADPNNFMSSPAFNNIWSLNGERVMHDTFPVPPALTDATGSNPNPAIPGRVFLKLTFKKREQIGRYVYHCHILEHEDGGMMAPIEVLDMDHATGRSTSNDESPSWIDRDFEFWKLMTNSQHYAKATLGQSLEGSICKPAIH
jgi:FtsP/CotA-like multicopper oxidase with cupredoxin domain